MYWDLHICEFQMHDSQSYDVCGKSRSCDFVCSFVKLDCWRSLCNVRELPTLNGGISCIALMHALLEREPPYIYCAMSAVSQQSGISSRFPSCEGRFKHQKV